VLGLSSFLPRNIAVLRSSEVGLDFDPRKRPLWKIYRYRVLRSPVEDPFLSDHAWRIGEKLDQSLMEAEARTLIGTFDFQAFRSAKDPRLNTVRTLSEVRVSNATDDPRCLDLWVQGDRFLYNMVRIIAGTLVDVGRGRLAPGSAQKALLGGDREQLGMTAPARGLSLEHVELPDWGQEPWPETVPAWPRQPAPF
jgi:tRNA pseudouridine38-40 synthase